MSALATALCAVALCALPATSRAQDADVRQSSTNGILAGPILLEPELFVEGSFDTNVFAQSTRELAAGASTTSAWLMIPGASLKASTLEPKDLDLTASARLAGELYMSSNDDVFSQSGVEFSTDAALTLNRLGLVAFQPSLGYKRTNTPQYTANQESYNEHILRLGLDAIIQPEGGHVFTSKLGYNLSAYFLEQFGDFNRQTHTLASHTRWNFLFQTALLLNIDWQLINYSTTTPSVQSLAVDPASVFNLTNVGSSPLRINTGLSSLLFGRLDIRLLAGYAYTFYDSGANDSLLLMHASAGYEWADRSKTRVGYVKDFSDTTFGNYFTFHRVFAQWDKSFFDKRLGTSLQTNVDIRAYSGVDSAPSRDETFVSLISSFDWRFIDAFRAGLRYQLTLNSTDFGLNLPTGAGTVVTFADYTKHLIFFNAAFLF